MNLQMVTNKLKKFDIKNFTYYYWNDLININVLGFNNTIKKQKIIQKYFYIYLTYKISYTTKTSSEILFQKISRYIKIILEINIW